MAKQAKDAFSLVEILLVVGVVAVIAGVTIPLISGVPDAAKKEKLERDVVVVNNAIDAYLAAGGNTNLTGDQVIDSLKSRIYGGMPAEMLGPQGPFLDPSVVTNATDFGWSAVFTNGPRPRFYVVQNSSGVVFQGGAIAAVGGVAERPDQARPSWLWSYGEATPPAEAEAFNPLAVDTGSTFTNPVTAMTNLGPPVVSPVGQTNELREFPLLVSISNTNTQGRSRVYYKIGGGNYILHDGTPVSVAPGASLLALCVSLDPSRFRNSEQVTNTYAVSPLKLAVRISAPSSVLYAQVGGLMEGAAPLAPASFTITLEDTNRMFGVNPDNLLVRETNNDKYIPPVYLRSTNFFVRYTLDGSDPLTSGVVGPAFNAFFSPIVVPLNLTNWTDSSLLVRAAAIAAEGSILFTNSDPAAANVGISPTELALTIQPANPIGLPLQVLINHGTNVPVGLRKFYTTNSSDVPLTSVLGGLVGANAVPYTGPITSLPKTTYTLKAQATGPDKYERWFSSPLAEMTYSTIGAVERKLLGANISGGDVNGSLRGSIFVSAPAELGNFNAGGQIINGNLYVPGTPAIEIPGSTANSNKVVVARGETYVERADIPRSLIAGKEYTADGKLANPQLDTRQVVDLDGSTNPTNYTVILTKSAFIEGKIYRRADPPAPEPPPPLPTTLTTYTNTFSGAFTNTIPGGVYSNRITMNRTNSLLRLGTNTTTTKYVFIGNTWSKGRVEILGPVEIFFVDGFDNKGVTFGSTNNIGTNSAKLTINVMTNDVNISDSAVFASMWAGRSTVTVGNSGFFYGGLEAYRLTVSPGGTVDVQ